MARRHGPLAAAIAAGTLLALGSAAPATALTRAKATRIALAALKPAKQQTTTGVVVYGLPHALRARDRVGEFHPVSHLKRAKKLGRRKWLFWEDLAPSALFAHGSVMLLVDDRTKRVEKQGFAWWPLVNGRPPAFLRRKPPRREVLFDSRDFKGHAVRTVSALPPEWRQATAPLQITRQDLAHDCLVTVGLENSNLAVLTPTADFAALRGWADSVGLNHYDGGDTAASLDAQVNSVVRTGCTDVFIFLAGHGTPPPGTWMEGFDRVSGGDGPASVLTRVRSDGHGGVDTARITPADLARIMAEHDNTKPVAQRATFKVKIMACFAARFADTLNHALNLEFSEYSSAADEASYDHIDEVGVPKNGRVQVIKNMTDNPQRVTEFMNRNIHGLDIWAHSQQAHNVPDLANGLTNAFEYGKPYDFSDAVGLTHAVKRYSPGAVDVTFPKARPLMVKIVNPGYDHTTPGAPPSKYPSTVCFDITTDPLQAGAAWTAVITPDGRTVTGKLDANGQAFVVLGIPAYGSYKVIAGVGDASNGDADEVTIDAPQPNPPAVPQSTRSCRGATPQ